MPATGLCISYQCVVLLHAVMAIMECLAIITITKCCGPTSTESTWYLVHIVLLVHFCVGFYSPYQFYTNPFVFIQVVAEELRSCSEVIIQVKLNKNQVITCSIYQILYVNAFA